MNIKVMTFNLRTPVKNDGVNYFPNREGNILEAIDRESPDLIGFQEAADYSRAFLKRSLSDYVVIGCGREKDYTGEACCIAFKKEKFDLISYKTQWLSTSPNISGSRFDGSDQSKCPRIFVHAELALGEDGKRLHFYNTHLDHKGDVAKLLGMTQIMQSISECDAPFVLTGDMNANADSAATQLPLMIETKQIKDATASVEYSFHDFGKTEFGGKIDYIYTDLPFLDTHVVEDKHENGVYISDHYLICTTVMI